MEVLEFKRRGEKVLNASYSGTRSFRTISSRTCASPITIERWEIGTACICFHTGCFTLALLENALKYLGYGEESVWRLRVFDRQSPPYVKYLLILQKDFKEETDNVLTAVIGRIIKEAYLAETRVWGDDVKLYSLVMPYQRKLEDGAQISNDTKEMLASRGVQNAWDLVDITREELCKMPNMTTREVYRLEKSLAVRGIFLKNKLPSLI